MVAGVQSVASAARGHSSYLNPTIATRPSGSKVSLSCHAMSGRSEICSQVAVEKEATRRRGGDEKSQQHVSHRRIAVV